MLPWLTTELLPAPVKANRPAMKLLSLIPKVEATRPPTLTAAVLPNKMPFGFSRKTLPLADKLPKILEGSLPTTRFSATELLPGWTNCTVWPAPIPKLCQLMTVLALDCVMVVALPLLVMFATPAATTPPTGEACATAPKARIRHADRVLMTKRVVPGASACLFFK